MKVTKTVGSDGIWLGLAGEKGSGRAMEEKGLRMTKCRFEEGVRMWKRGRGGLSTLF